MIELITVILIVGILGAIGAARFFDRKGYDTIEFADQAKAMLRYGQKLAIAQHRPVFVRLDGASVALCFATACAAGASRVTATAGSNSGSSATLAACANDATWACEGLPSGVAYSLASGPSAFYFDALGRPYLTTDTAGGTSNFTRLIMSITGDKDVPSHGIIVEPETAYVHTQ